MKRWLALLAVSCSAPAHLATDPSTGPQVRQLGPRDEHRYALVLRRGESRDVVVTQDGIDVVVTVLAPDRHVLGEVDSPNGRRGDEPVEIVAETAGTYEIIVRPNSPGEPAGRYRIAVTTTRDETETRALLDRRGRERADAAHWLGARAGDIRVAEHRIMGRGVERFDALVARARVIGIGEATHGSRQIADARVALALHAIEHDGVRLVALEASASRIRMLDRWVATGSGDPETAIGSFWINRRAFLELARAVRAWNVAHPNDAAALLGLDDQDNAVARDALARFAARASRPDTVRLGEVLGRIAKADTQATVFGPSDVAPDDWRYLAQVVEELHRDRSALATRLSVADVDDALAAARTIAQFAELNSGAEGARSRDRLMAENLLAGLGPTTHAILLGHNLHVSHPPDRPVSRRTTGNELGERLGRDYAALATTFRSGSVLVQLPNDPGDRLQIFPLARSPDASIDGVLDTLGDTLATWPDGARDAPPWLAAPQPMHWIGALFSGETSPNVSLRPSQLLVDYDGILFVRIADAETSDQIGVARAPARP